MFGFLAQLLAWCYDVVPNYGLAIILFTLIIMIVVTPFTIKGMRSMAEMARIQPEMKRLQDQYKNDRVKLNDEMQALFKEHKVNPLGGCLPNLIPLPAFFITFRLLERLTSRHHHHIFDPRRVLNGLPDPHYLTHDSSLYRHLVADGGRMVTFGMDLGKSARDAHGSIGAALPFYALIAIMTASTFFQQRQMSARTPQSSDSSAQQMKIMMQIFPIFYAVISLTIPASVVLYLLVSGLFRMAQQTLSYRYDPHLVRSSATAAPGAGNAKSSRGTQVIEAGSRAKPGARDGARAAVKPGAGPQNAKGLSKTAAGAPEGKSRPEAQNGGRLRDAGRGAMPESPQNGGSSTPGNASIVAGRDAAPEPGEDQHAEAPGSQAPAPAAPPTAAPTPAPDKPAGSRFSSPVNVRRAGPVPSDPSSTGTAKPNTSGRVTPRGSGGGRRRRRGR